VQVEFLQAQLCNRIDGFKAETVNGLDNEVLRRGMMHDDGGGALLGIEQKSGGQMHTDVFVRMQQCEQLRLVFQIGARRVTK
jgi:hypothetical protein